MGASSEIMSLSPYSFVNLQSVALPQDGFQLSTPDLCRRAFTKDDACHRHYERLFDSVQMVGKPVQCPHGFSSFVVMTNTQHLAITAVVPFPRGGGSCERAAAKKYPNPKVTPLFGKSDGSNKPPASSGRCRPRMWCVQTATTQIAFATPFPSCHA